MPAPAYSQYQDPETGETLWLPQLFPHARMMGEMTSKEIEIWVSTGAVPSALYESELHSIKKMEEIRNKLENKEHVLASELPPNPEAFTEYILKNKAILYGEAILQKIFSRLDDNDPDIVWLSFIKEALTSIVAKDPLPIHFHVARIVLKDKYNIEDSSAVDILAREFLEHCRNILNLEALSHPVFQKIVIEPKDCNDHLENKGSSRK